MPLYRYVEFALIVLIIHCSLCANAQGEWNLSRRTNIIDSTSVLTDIGRCEAFIVLSKDQCSNCNKNVPDLLKLLGKKGYKTTILRVVDQDLMACKSDEMTLRQEATEIEFHYISEKQINLIAVNDGVIGELYKFKDTPVLLTVNSDKIYLLNSEELVDEFGRLQDVKSNIIPCKGAIKSKN